MLCECSLVPLGLCVTMKTWKWPWKWPGSEAHVYACVCVACVCMCLFLKVMKHLQVAFVTCQYQMTVDVLVSQSHIVSLHSHEVTFVVVFVE